MKLLHSPKQIEFIQQRKKSDCGIACVAMLVRRLYEDIVTLFPELVRRTGLHLDEITDVLDAFGYCCVESKSLPRGVALIAIQWKNKRLSGHYVVWDGKRNQFLDPLHGIISKKNMLKVAKMEVILKVTKMRS